MSQSANNLIERLKLELSIKKDKDLCMLLDIKQNTLSTWRKRDSIDFNKVIALCEERNLDLNYIFFYDNKGAGAAESKPQKPRYKKALVVKSVFSGKLVNSKRSIELFVMENNLELPTNHTKILVTQQASTFKLSENVKYVFTLKVGDSFVDTPKLETKNNSTIINLEKNEFTIEPSEIASVWQVMGDFVLDR